MNTLKLLNEEMAHNIDGDLIEFTPWHVAAFKAAIATTNNEPCTDEGLVEEMFINTDNFGATKTQVEYCGTLINKNNDDVIMLIDQYGLSISKCNLANRWTVYDADDEDGYSNECLHTELANCIANLSPEMLGI